ncbi:urea carboxylase [Dentipellis sp. KUC8613]|nr:urea carboxylase [Dentipellis sp. KUC8613]
MNPSNYLTSLAQIFGHKLLIANRGEIAVRIIRTATRLGIPTVAIYTPTDALSPHVSLATQAVALPVPDTTDAAAAARGYLDSHAILQICKAHAVTLVHPGYGFLSENEEFARMLHDAGVAWLGPHPDAIHAMGLKHKARALAEEAQVPVVPGSKDLLHDLDHAVVEAGRVGYPVMLKSTAGGGGMGLVVCAQEAELREKFGSTQARAQMLFKNDGLFLERYVPASRHVEVQVFGNGLGHAVHFGERECSVQRRHQKVIEETPSPFVLRNLDAREKMCSAALRLCKSIQYASAGTCEFLVDDKTGEFFFLEMNTRLQVEHPITEAVRPGLDIVELMILQGIAQHDSPLGGLGSAELDRLATAHPAQNLHAIEARVYCENAAAGFQPSPGVLQYVEFGPKADWLRVDSWVETGTTITPYFDPLACKLIVTGATRDEAIARMLDALASSKIHGPPNNMAYLRAICNDATFRAGNALTTFLDDFTYVPRAMDVLSGGLDTTIQDYPGRLTGLGVPRSGPMDSLAARAANLLVLNPAGTELLELTFSGPALRFRVPAVVAVTGAPAKVTLDGRAAPMWARLAVRAGAELRVGAVGADGAGAGFRAYLAVRGGFPEVPAYLGSKSTSMGLGGYQGRSLVAGDHLALGACEPDEDEDGDHPAASIPSGLIPIYSTDWTVRCLPGPHGDEDFLTPAGLEAFYSTAWLVSASSNRMGVRLEGPKILWARQSGGEGGSHPSNIHDNGYALGSVNLNGDTPVILTNEGPDMGGYVCACTVATADMWKLGQLRPGSTVRFERVSFADAMRLKDSLDATLRAMEEAIACGNGRVDPPPEVVLDKKAPMDAKLHIIEQTGERPCVVFRQAGDSAILVEYGPLLLDFNLRARIHAFETVVKERGVKGVLSFGPCIRSTMCRYDPSLITQSALLSELVAAEFALPDTTEGMTFPSRKIVLPIVLDDRWNREALQRYMRSIRDKAVYLPSNIDYLALNNGLNGGAEEALRLLVASDWIVFGVGFYLACPFLVPIDPRSRLVGQKMNPSRTYTPRGAIGIAGLVAAIYPVESPGGYQLFGRTLPAWQTWGRGADFTPDCPWLLRPFDQVGFEVVTEEEYLALETLFDAGRYKFKIIETTFSMPAYDPAVAAEVARFKERQAEGVRREEARETELLSEWEAERAAASAQGHADVPSDEIPPTAHQIPAPLPGTLTALPLPCSALITAPDTVVAMLEAMKTAVPVLAGSDAVGRRVGGFGAGAEVGRAVRAGETLVWIE